MPFLVRYANLWKYGTAVALLSLSLVNISYAATAGSARIVTVLRPFLMVIRVVREPLSLVAEDARTGLERMREADAEGSELDVLIGQIADRRLRGYLEQIDATRKFLAVSEPLFYPELGPEELARQERALIMGFLIIWLSENPKSAEVQSGGGPAVGWLQIEPATAIDYLQRALRKPSDHPQRALTDQILASIDPSGQLAVRIEESGFETEDERRVQRFLLDHPVLQLLVWRLFVANAAREMPRTREDWSLFHAEKWNTAYWCDLERYNADSGGFFCRDPRLGLAIPYKTKMMSRVIGRWMVNPMGTSLVEKQCQISKSMRATVKDTGRILEVYKHLTRALRQVRNVEVALGRLEERYGPNPPVRGGAEGPFPPDIREKLRGYRDTLDGLMRRGGHFDLARRELDRLALYYKPKGLSPVQWESELSELNSAIGVLKTGIERLKGDTRAYLGEPA